MKKIIALVLAIALALSLSVSAFATELYNLTEKSSEDGGAIDGYVISGWCPSLITEYQFPQVMADFKAAIQTEGAKIEVVSSGPINGILLQAYPLDGGSNYPHIIFTEGTSTEVDGKTVTVYDCAAFIAAYTSTDHTDDPSVKLSMDSVLNFAVDASEGTVLTSVRVYTEDEAPADDTADEAAPAESTDTEEAPAEDTTPAETGIVLAVLPMAVAAAAVVVARKRK